MANIENRCFIGGLTEEVDNQELKAAFSLFGEVIDAEVIKNWETDISKGFGFVTFKDEKCMREAIQVTNGKTLRGRKLKVEEAKSKRRGPNYNSDMEDLSRMPTQRYKKQAQLTDEELKMLNNMKKLFGIR